MTAPDWSVDMVLQCVDMTAPDWSASGCVGIDLGCAVAAANDGAI
jgi:hypothetical protein